MVEWRWYSPTDYLPAPGALVLVAELVNDPAFPTDFIYPAIAWMDIDLTWRKREHGVPGGRVIEVAMWAHIPPVDGMGGTEEIVEVSPVRKLFKFLGGFGNA